MKKCFVTISNLTKTIMAAAATGACSTLRERQEANAANPCAKPWSPVFPPWLVNSVAPGILFTGMTIIGYGLSTSRGWALSGFTKPSTQLSVMMMLMAADLGSTFWDHSRISDEEFCLTSSLAGDWFDDATGRMVFGALSALLAAVSAFGVKTGSVALSSTGIPFAAMMGYLAWSPQTFQSCRNNGLVTGLLAFGLDIMTLVGILEVLLAETGNRDTSWHNPTIAFSAVISALFVLLIGRFSDYAQRIKPGSCEIDDDGDLEDERRRDRKPELFTGIAFSVASVAYFVYLKMKFAEVSCCAVYPVLVFLLFDVLTKLQVWKRGEPLTGDALHRSVIYVMVQVMDVLLSSSSMISVMADKGLLVANAPPAISLLGHAGRLAGGSLTYLLNVARLVVSLIANTGLPSTTGSLKRLAEITKTVGLNVVANAVPLAIDSKNATYMLAINPTADLNVPCFVE